MMKRILSFALLGVCACSASDANVDASVDPGTDGGFDSGVDLDSGTADPLEYYVFVTNTSHDGAIGGIAGADAICASQAETAGLEGQFKAWLSTLSSPASDRLVQSDVPYVLVDGTHIADDWNDLTDGSIRAPINLDASGQRLGGDVWTGTLPSGASYVDGDCEGFTSNAGDLRSLCGSTAFTNASWTAAQTPDCSSQLRLFCIEQ